MSTIQNATNCATFKNVSVCTKLHFRTCICKIFTATDIAQHCTYTDIHSHLTSTIMDISDLKAGIHKVNASSKDITIYLPLRLQNLPIHAQTVGQTTYFQYRPGRLAKLNSLLPVPAIQNLYLLHSFMSCLVNDTTMTYLICTIMHLWAHQRRKGTPKLTKTLTQIALMVI
jgi:hypothetical protein